MIAVGAEPGVVHPLGQDVPMVFFFLLFRVEPNKSQISRDPLPYSLPLEPILVGK